MIFFCTLCKRLFNMGLFGNKDGKYCVYILYKNDNPIYIGMSSKIYNRINWHKKTKEFTHYAILGCFSNRQDALFVERTLIKFVCFCGYDFLNYKFIKHTPKKILV